jgi:hypothetical protein
MGVFRFCATGVVALSVVSPAAWGVFATHVESYDAGTLDDSFSSYTTPGSALGAPAPVVGIGAFPSVLSAFNPAWQASEIVLIGDGGQLTLKLGAPVPVGTGREIGVISNVGLIDAGGSASPGGFFGGGSAEVLVSDGVSAFKSLGVVDFNNPASYFTNAGPYDSAAPSNPKVSDFNKPFDGDIDTFAGQSYTGVVNTFGGSIGGTWIDASPSGLSSVQYVKFVVADDDDPFTKLAIDAVTSVPEPAAVGILLCAASLLARRRHHAH